MPFVQTTREKVDQLGLKALALTLEFDEAEILRNNSIYLANTLDVSNMSFCWTVITIKSFQVEEVTVKFTDDADASEKMKECCPGSPFVLFSTKPGVKLELVNPVPGTGLFSRYLVISDGDTHRKIVDKLCKHFKQIKSNIWKLM